MPRVEDLAASTPTARIGLGLAAVGRPAYINVGHDVDLPAERSVDALRSLAQALLDQAYSCGVRYFDAARSYGLAEDFLGDWLRSRTDVEDVVVGSKWGYTYVADWHVDAPVHEVKDHGLATFERQIAETRALLGQHLDIYHVHSVTPESPVLSDLDLQRRLAGLAAEGVLIGLSTSGPGQADAIRAALEVTVDGTPLFRSVQSTWNLLETSAGDALAEAHEAGCVVIVKEALANGRLAARDDGRVATTLGEVSKALSCTPDAVAIAAALSQPWATIVLSGAATTAQLSSNLAAASVNLEASQLARLAGLVELPDDYWQTRSKLVWT